MLVPGEVKYFVFSGGGINGFAHIGVWRFLEEVWHANGISMIKSMEGAAGASVGAIVALAMVLGFTSHELEAFAVDALDGAKGVESINIRGLLDGTSTGLLSWKIISEFVRGVLKLKTGNSDITFGELRDHCACEYVCTAHNITELRSEYFGTTHTPDVAVWKGVTMSCLNPVLFDCMEHNGCEYYDGGLSNSIPFEVFPPANTLVSMITRTPGGRAESIIGRFTRIVEAFDTAAKQKIKAHEEELAAVIRVYINVSTSEHVITTGELKVNNVRREELIRLGRSSAMRELHHDLWIVVRSLQAILTNNVT